MARKKKKILLFIAGLLLCFLVFMSYMAYNYFYAPNVKIAKTEFLYIPTGSNIDDVFKLLEDKNIIVDMNTFLRAAKIMKYSKAKSGRYEITDGMNNKSLVSMLRSGNQAAVRVTLAGNIRSNSKIASIASKYIEPDSISILQMLNDNDFLGKFGFNSQTVLGMFIPNTYEVYWNSSAEEFAERMYREYEKFWNDARKSKLQQTGLTQIEVITMASIVNEETNIIDEMATIAGVYVNRIHSGMALQADPTVKFALGDFSIRRVLDRHTEYDSPYNTYNYKGLPPAPICMPSIAAIDAVLNYEHHDYYYFCAKDDFSGRHSFEKTLAQHNLNANSYHKALNRRNIR